MLQGNNKSGTVIMRMACAIFFILFTFFYLYDYQADVIAVTQYVLSQGVTHYNRTIGAVLITFVLWLVQMGVYAVTKLWLRTHALTYLPSLLLLAILTDVSPHLDEESYLGPWLWLFPLLMVVYAAVVAVCRQIQSLDIQVNAVGLFSRIVWVNMLLMVIMALTTVAIGCNDTLFHHRMRMESDILSHRHGEALQVGQREARTDSSLTCLRVYALSLRHELGERLFTYPLVGGSEAMLPNGKSVKMMMVPETDVYKHLGVCFQQKLSPKVYLEKLHEKHWATPAAHDWLLCAYLLDGDLDHFAGALQRYYHVGDSIDNRQGSGQNLPLHYREALTLYNHISRAPRVVYHNAVMDADFEDFMDLLQKNPDPRARYTAIRDTYAKTYWFYYKTFR